MTELVNPTANRDAEPRQTAAAIAYGATGYADGWVVPNTISVIADTEGLSGTPLDRFQHHTTQMGDLTARFGSGEAFVGGAWLAKDETTSVPLPASTTTTVCLGWSPASPDTVKIAPEADFLPRDSYMPIWDVTTDASTQTSRTDLRGELYPKTDVVNERYEGGDGVVDEAAHAGTADSATNATNATNASFATNAGAVEGKVAGEIGRNFLTLPFNVARLKPGDRWQIPVYVPSGNAFKVMRVSRQTNTFSSPSALLFRIRNSGGSVVYESTSRSASTSNLNSPLYEGSGGTEYLVGLENTASSTEYKAGGYCQVVFD